MRKTVDCRTMPSDAGCSLAISGTEEEVVRAAVDHAVASHGHQDSEDLRAGIRAGLVDEGRAGRYGTVMLATLTGDVDALRRALETWAEQRRVPGFAAEEVLVADDGTVAAAVFFDSRQAYEQLAADPEQGRWWQEQMAPLLSDVRWVDGSWQQAITRQPARIPVQPG